MKYHCAYGYIGFLRAFATLVFIAAAAVCSAVFFISPPTGIVIFSFILPIYIVFLLKVIPLFAASHLYTQQRTCFLICGGIIFKKVRRIPFGSITAVNMRRSFAEKIFNIMSVELVLGAGKIRMFGLSESDAEKIFKYRS